MTRGFAVNDTFGDDPAETYKMARPRLSRLALRSDRPKRFSPIDADLFQSPFCSGNALCPCARVLW